MSTNLVSADDVIAILMPDDYKFDSVERSKLIRILDSFINGTNLLVAIEKEKWDYKKFRFIMSKYPVFAQNFKIGAAIHGEAMELKMLGNLELASIKDWKAAKEVLKILKPEKYGDKPEPPKKDDVPLCMSEYVDAQIVEEEPKDASE